MDDAVAAAGAKKTYEAPTWAFEGALEELTLLPTFAVCQYEYDQSNCIPLS